MKSNRFTLISLIEIPQRIIDLADVDVAQAEVDKDIEKMVLENNKFKIVGNKPKCKHMSDHHMTDFSTKFPDYTFMFTIVIKGKMTVYKIKGEKIDCIKEIGDSVDVANDLEFTILVGFSYDTTNVMNNITSYFDDKYRFPQMFEIGQHFLMLANSDELYDD